MWHPPAVLRSGDQLCQAAALTDCSFSWTSLDVDDCCNPILPYHFPASVSIYACHLTPSSSFHSPVILLADSNLLLFPPFPFLLFLFFRCFYRGMYRSG